MLNEFRLQLDRLRAKYNLVKRSSDSSHTQRFFQFYIQITEKLLDAERGSIFIVDHAKQHAWLKVGTGVKERQIEVPAAESLVGRVIATGQPVIETGLQNRQGVHARIAEETGFVSRDALCVPIKSIYRNEVIGAIEVLNKHGGNEFSKQDVVTLEEIAYFLQDEIERTFLDQEVLGTTERLFSVASKAVYALVGLVVMVFLAIIAIFLVQGFAPMMFR